MGKDKLVLPFAILLASIILGGFYYATQVNKQQSIERQQKIKMEQRKKEYVVKRRKECCGIYEKERDRVSNVEWWSYDEARDVCVITYRNKKIPETGPFYSGLVDTDGDGEKDTYEEGRYFQKEF